MATDKGVSMNQLNVPLMSKESSNIETKNVIISNNENVKSKIKLKPNENRSSTTLKKLQFQSDKINSQDTNQVQTISCNKDKLVEGTENDVSELEFYKNKCKELEKKLATVEQEVVQLQNEKRAWMDREVLYELNEQQIKNELFEMSKRNRLCNAKPPDESNNVVSDLSAQLQKAVVENNTIKFQLTLIELQLQEALQCNKQLQKCLDNNQKNTTENDDRHQNQQTNRKHKEVQTGGFPKQYEKPKSENKEVQATEYLGFQATLKKIVASLDLEDCKKSLLLSSLNQTDNICSLIYHMKLVYSEFITTNKCNKEQEKQLRCLEGIRNDLTKRKEKLEKSVQKLSELCKAFQALSEVQEKEIHNYKDIKLLLCEKIEKCDFLTRRLNELEAAIQKTKDRKNLFKKKYFKERHANRKKVKKKNESWLTKFFDWSTDN